jgi:hypothetical protein
MKNSGLENTLIDNKRVIKEKEKICKKIEKARLGRQKHQSSSNVTKENEFKSLELTNNKGARATIVRSLR